LERFNHFFSNGITAEQSLVAIALSAFVWIVITYLNNNARRLDGLILYRVEKLIEIRRDFGNRHTKAIVILNHYIREIAGEVVIDDLDLLNPDKLIEMDKELSSYTAFIFGCFREVEPYLSDYEYFSAELHEHIKTERTRLTTASKDEKLKFKTEALARVETLNYLAAKFAYKSDNACYELVRGYGFFGKMVHRLRSKVLRQLHLIRRIWLKERHNIHIPF